MECVVYTQQINIFFYYSLRKAMWRHILETEQTFLQMAAKTF